MSKLTQKRLKELLNYDSETGIFTWKISRQGTSKGETSGCVDKEGYIQIRVDYIKYYAHRLAWLYEKGYFPENGLDHKDQTKHHNWIKNLRELTTQCNARNCGNPKNNTSGVKGVTFNKNENKWKAHVMVSGKTKHLGSYGDISEAVCARLAGEQCLNWSGCDSSSPAYKYVKGLIS